jgi:hypothetical protein
MFSGSAGQAGDGVAVDADEAAGLPGAVSLSEVIEHRTSLVLREVRAKKGSAFALGEAVFAGPAIKQADVVLLAEMPADSKVSCAAMAVKRTVRMQAAEARKVVHVS